MHSNPGDLQQKSLYVAWFGIQTHVSSTQSERSNSYIFVGWVLEFHFLSCKAFFFVKVTLNLINYWENYGVFYVGIFQ